MKHINIIQIFFLGVILSSCLAPSLEKNFSLHNDTGSGVVIASSTFEYVEECVKESPLSDWKPSWFQHSIMHTDGNRVSYPDGRPTRFNSDTIVGYKIDGRPGRVNALKLDEGSYFINSWSTSGYNTHIFAASPYRMPFNIKAGEIKYLGNIHVYIYDGCQKIKTLINNESERDIKIVTDWLDNVGVLDVKIDILSGPIYY